MKRRIFIGSSSEGYTTAEDLKDILNQNPNVQCELWKSVFKPDLLTFEALERMLHRESAAVFVVEPDDKTTIRGHRVKVPRANVLVEFGLAAGRLGRENVVLCKYEGALLPSDLTGLTVINMDPDPADPLTKTLSAEDKLHFRQRAEDTLKEWSGQVLATAEEVPRTVVHHGYTGRWGFDLVLQSWREIKITNPDLSVLKGSIDIFVHADGRSGEGFAHGDLTFFLAARPQPVLSEFSGVIRVAHRIKDVRYRENGSLEFTSELFSLDRGILKGKPWPQLKGLSGPPEPWSFAWRLHPSAGPHKLGGHVKTEAGGTEGLLSAVKTSAGTSAAAGA